MIGCTRIELSGNPFVDTGLGVIASLTGLSDINDLALSHLYKVHGNGDQLTRWNSRLKSFTQIFGTNNPLYQYSYGFKKGKGPSEVNIAVYKSTLEGLLSAIPKLGTGERCWACGSPSSFDFAQICRKAVEASNLKAPKNKVVGRDWFPLAGSLGSDAQSLPAASRPPHICPRCLLAVHYLPLGLILLNGRLAVFQSTSQKFWYELICDIVNVYKGRVDSGDYETLGAKEGGRAFVERLLALFERLRREAHPDIPEALYVWRFTNSGASPDCAVEEIPDPALRFLSKAAGEGLRHDIMSLMASEGKGPQYSLYQCILDGRDYPKLYPEGKRKGASPKLYAIYQTCIRDHSAKALHAAHKLARTVSSEISEKELKRMQRREAFREMSIRNQFRAIMARMTIEGQFTLDEYLDLFPLKEGRGITVEWDGWNIVRFYLHHANEDFTAIETEQQDGKEPCHLLLYCAGQIYRMAQLRIGEAWNNKESKSKKLNIRCRKRAKDSAVFLFTVDQTVLAQFSIPTTILQGNNILEAYKRIISAKDSSVKGSKATDFKIKDLKVGMRKVNLKARVLEIPEPRMVYTAWGTDAHVSNALIADETGKVRMSLWNEQINMVSEGDSIKVENAKVARFKGELQLRIGRNGSLSTME